MNANVNKNEYKNIHENIKNITFIFFVHLHVLS